MRYCIAQPYEVLTISNLANNKQQGVILTTEIIIEQVISYYNVYRSVMNSNSHKRDAVFPRNVAIYFIKQFIPKMTLAAIGKIFNRDHSTIIYSIDTINDLLFYDKKVKRDIEIINAKLRAKKKELSELQKGDI